MIYNIKEGNHYADFTFPKFEMECKLEVLVYLNKSLEYLFANKDSFDTNKLIGISETINHHKTSLRLGWRFASIGHIELMAYIYDGGIRKIRSLGFKKSDDIFDLKLKITSKSFKIDMDGVSILSEPRCSKKGFIWWPHRILRPYFGGQNVAPHDIKTVFYKKSS